MKGLKTDAKGTKQLLATAKKDMPSQLVCGNLSSPSSSPKFLNFVLILQVYSVDRFVEANLHHMA